jgi:Fe2+ transport system protein FeoA
LRELGLCQGCRVQLVRGGDPVILEVHGSRLAVSAELARRVIVECQSN